MLDRKVSKKCVLSRYNVSRLRDSINVPVQNFQNIEVEAFQILKNYSGYLIVICSNTPRDATLVKTIFLISGWECVSQKWV